MWSVGQKTPEKKAEVSFGEESPPGLHLSLCFGRLVRRWLVRLARGLGSGGHLLLRSASLALGGGPGRRGHGGQQWRGEVRLLGLLLLLVPGEAEEEA